MKPKTLKSKQTKESLNSGNGPRKAQKESTSGDEVGSSSIESYDELGDESDEQFHVEQLLTNRLLRKKKQKIKKSKVAKTEVDTSEEEELEDLVKSLIDHERKEAPRKKKMKVSMDDKESDSERSEEGTDLSELEIASDSEEEGQDDDEEMLDLSQNAKSSLKQALKSLHLNLPWSERLDLVVDPAALAPELQEKEEEHASRRSAAFANQKSKKQKAEIFDISKDPVHNDFKRELMFYRLGQSGIQEGIPLLQKNNIPTRRPEDYFAEMAKSDEHMQRVRHKLLEKKESLEKSAKARRLRELKKHGKMRQVEAIQAKHKEKRELMEKVKKFRKGQKDALDFLDEPAKKGGKKKVSTGGDSQKKPGQNKR
ncbi:unnamed protein product [Cyprideis torosa]|uniref:Uncharacterized protein n=1 Tax=Cyprideis torosa TaxID=163714 RepID=A0A7R8W560_9CRUS|nr:unnamed protein product [Cyprideis torosa]CAG0884923.1 unnamed protein product [Cyprideis torosa]